MGGWAGLADDGRLWTLRSAWSCQTRPRSAANRGESWRDGLRWRMTLVGRRQVATMPWPCGAHQVSFNASVFDLISVPRLFGLVRVPAGDMIPVVRSVPGATCWGRTSETMKSEPDTGENRSVNPPEGAGAVPENIKPCNPILSWGFVGLIFSRFQGQCRLSPPTVPSAQPFGLAYDARWQLFRPTAVKPVRNPQRSPVPNTA